jgi:hypothetical protein
LHEIEDGNPFDKVIVGGHARSAHLLREPPACYTRFDLGLDTVAAVELGKASARQEGIE